MQFEPHELIGFPLWQYLPQSSFILPKVRNMQLFFLGAIFQTVFSSFTMALGKGTIGRVDHPELIVQAGIKHCNENIKTHISEYPIPN